MLLLLLLPLLFSLLLINHMCKYKQNDCVRYCSLKARCLYAYDVSQRANKMQRNGYMTFDYRWKLFKSKRSIDGDRNDDMTTVFFISIQRPSALHTPPPTQRTYTHILCIRIMMQKMSFSHEHMLCITWTHCKKWEKKIEKKRRKQLKYIVFNRYA